ncbi:MAG: hypothetical protein KJZ86_14220 [Caldilineaceae bacterium]|nr:hypothetical protein [Caldilineaceae bacterium]HRJ41682.1 hypothetical protein [Caldilineaceae bacterium]
MKIYRNLAEIKRKESMGRRITLGGLAVLFVGLLASFTPNWFPPDAQAANGFIAFVQSYWAYISFGALALGFLASNVGSYYINRFAPRRWPDSNRIARPDELVEQNLKGFDDKYALFLWSLPNAPYLLAGPTGIQVFVVRGDKGQVNVSGDRWKEPFSIGRIFTAFTREGLGNPGREVEELKQKVRELLQAGEADGRLSVKAGDVPMEGAVVFVNPSINLQLDNPSVPVVPVAQLKKVIRSGKGQPLNGNEVRALTDYLRDVAVISEA